MKDPDNRRCPVVFDLGGVLLDWDPRHLYRRLFAGDEAAMERFLAEVCTPDWNRLLDAGTPFAAAVDALIARHPQQADLIRAYDARWPEMVAGPIAGSVVLLAELKSRRTPLYVLSNFPVDKYQLMRRRFSFLGWFDGVVISGEVGVCKPDAGIYQALLARYRLEAGACLFVDDRPANVAAARALGMAATLFRSPTDLRQALRAAGLLPGPAEGEPAARR